MNLAMDPAGENRASASLGPALKSAAARLAELSDSPRLDAEVLLTHVLGRDRAYLRAWPERALSPAQADQYRHLVEQRAEGWPVAYLTGEREFWSRPFKVRPGVLIPRPETELLIELALDLVPAEVPTDLLDLGTGSGIIAVTLAAERPLARVLATDISPDALAIARDNAVRHGVANLRFQCGHWFDAVGEEERFDLIVSNPPYIPQRDPHLRRGDLRFEPELALAAGPEGLDALTAIAEGARHRLKARGCLALEHGYDQAEAVATLLMRLGYADILHHHDIQGHRRATTAGVPPSPPP